jgi:hypothetical protein
MVATLYYPDYSIIERSNITNRRRFLADEKYPINSEPLDDSTVDLFCARVSPIIWRSKNDDLAHKSTPSILSRQMIDKVVSRAGAGPNIWRSKTDYIGGFNSRPSDDQFARKCLVILRSRNDDLTHESTSSILNRQMIDRVL